MYSESTPFSLWIMVMVSTGLPAFSLRPQFVLPRAVRSCHCSAQNLPIASVLRAKAKVLAMVTKSYYHSDFFSYFPLIHFFQHSGLRTFPLAHQGYSCPCGSLCLQHSSLRELQGSLPCVLQILALLPLSLSLTSLSKAKSLNSLFSNSLILLFYPSTSHPLT